MKYQKQLGRVSLTSQSLQELLDRNIVRNGSGFQDLVDNCPEEVIPVLRDHSVTKLGEFQAPVLFITLEIVYKVLMLCFQDSEVIQAFGQKSMLTRGYHILHDPFWTRNWRKFIEKEAGNREISGKDSLQRNPV